MSDIIECNHMLTVVKCASRG